LKRNKKVRSQLTGYEQANKRSTGGEEVLKKIKKQQKMIKIMKIPKNWLK
jgi:hypothetical protein